MRLNTGSQQYLKNMYHKNNDMKKILFILFALFALSANAQIGLLKPGYIGWPNDSTANAVLGWNPSTYKCEWLESAGGGDSLVITNDSICVIYLGDTLCVGANQQDSFYLSGDTSLCVIHLGDTLCSPYSSAGTTIYTGNGAFPQFAARVVNMNEGSLKFDRKSGFYQGGGNIRFPQAGTYPLMQINNGVVGNSTSPSLEFTPAFSGEDDLFVDFNGPTAAEDYSFGVARSASLNPFTIAEGIDLGASAGRPMMQFYGAGDSIVVVNNLLAGGAALNLQSTTTLAPAAGSVHDRQKVLNVQVGGANAATGASTYAATFANVHTGTASINIGVRSDVSGGLGANFGLWGEVSGTNAVGVYGSTSGTSNAYGVYGSSSANGGYGVYGMGSVTGSIPIVGTGTTTTLNAAQPILVLESLENTAGNAAPGFGGYIQFKNRYRNFVASESNTLKSTWTDTTAATLTSKLLVTGKLNASSTDIISFEGNKRVLFYGRSEEQQGADVASASTVALGLDGNTFEITGTTTINLISSLNWVNGSTITLMFSSSVTINDGTANSGTDIGIELDGNANFGATADDLLTLKLGEIGGVQRWREVSRSAN